MADAPSTGVTRIEEPLSNHIRSSYPPSAGLYLMAFMAALCGAYLIAIGLDYIGEDSKVHAPRWIFTWYGGYFVTVAFMLAGPALWRSRPMPPGPAWKHDYKWDSRGIADSTDSKLGAHLFSIVMVLGFLAPGIGLWPEISRAMFSGWTGPIWMVGFGLFGLIMLIVMLDWFWRLAGRLRHGRARLRFSQFPYHIGRPIEVTYEGPADLSGELASIVLRCVEDRVVERGHGSESREQVMAFAIYRQTLAATIDRMGRLKLAFDLPRDLPPTQLRGVPARYWEVVVRVERSGPDFEAIFLVPVYD